MNIKTNKNVVVKAPSNGMYANKGDVFVALSQTSALFQPVIRDDWNRLMIQLSQRVGLNGKDGLFADVFPIRLSLFDHWRTAGKVEFMQDLLEWCGKPTTTFAMSARLWAELTSICKRIIADGDHPSFFEVTSLFFRFYLEAQSGVEWAEAGQRELAIYGRVSPYSRVFPELDINGILSLASKHDFISLENFTIPEYPEADRSFTELMSVLLWCAVTRSLLSGKTEIIDPYYFDRSSRQNTLIGDLFDIAEMTAYQGLETTLAEFLMAYAVAPGEKRYLPLTTRSLPMKRRSFARLILFQEVLRNTTEWYQ